MTCEPCKSSSPRYDFNRRCCLVRWLRGAFKPHAKAQLALMAFIDVKMDIYAESRKRAKAKKRISNAKVTGSPALSASPCGLPGYAAAAEKEMK